MSLPSISRQLLQPEHQRLRSHIPETNKLGDLSIKWHRFGEAAATIIEQAQYQRVIAQASGKLALMDPAEVAQLIHAESLPVMPSGNGKITAEVMDVRYFGDGPFSSIAYVLDCPLLNEQRDHITRSLDRLNGRNAWWGDNFTPHVTVATVPAVHESDAVLDAFWSFAPATMTLHKAMVKA